MIAARICREMSVYVRSEAVLEISGDMSRQKHLQDPYIDMWIKRLRALVDAANADGQYFPCEWHGEVEVEPATGNWDCPGCGLTNTDF